MIDYEAVLVYGCKVTFSDIVGYKHVKPREEVKRTKVKYDPDTGEPHTISEVTSPAGTFMCVGSAEFFTESEAPGVVEEESITSEFFEEFCEALAHEIGAALSFYTTEYDSVEAWFKPRGKLGAHGPTAHQKKRVANIHRALRTRGITAAKPRLDAVLCAW